MILKWNDPWEVWHLHDGVNNVVVHGRMTLTKIQNQSKIYDGDDAIVFHNTSFHPDYDSTEENWYQYIVVTGRNGREHWAMNYGNLYVMSDEGKTVDNYY